MNFLSKKLSDIEYVYTHTHTYIYVCAYTNGMANQWPPSLCPPFFTRGGGVGWWEPKLFFFPLKLSIKIIFQT